MKKWGRRQQQRGNAHTCFHNLFSWKSCLISSYLLSFANPLLLSLFHAVFESPFCGGANERFLAQRTPVRQETTRATQVFPPLPPSSFSIALASPACAGTVANACTTGGLLYTRKIARKELLRDNSVCTYKASVRAIYVLQTWQMLLSNQSENERTGACSARHFFSPLPSADSAHSASSHKDLEPSPCRGRRRRRRRGRRRHQTTL